MVPNGWKLGTIEEISSVSSGGTPSRKNESYWNGNIPWVTTAEVKFNIIEDTAEKITEEGLANSSAKLFPVDTILIAMYGQGKTRGQVAKLGIEASTNQACAAIILKAGYYVDYYYQFLISQYDNIREMANSGGQENLSGGIVKSIKVPVPPLPEQNKIAQILSTWDKAISTTEQLLANSQQQKKALMQQLLTGKKRLLDSNGVKFSGEWKSIPLAKLGDVIGGLTYSPSDVTDASGMLVLRSSNIQNGVLSFEDNVYVSCTISDKSMTRDNDILLCVRNGSRALIGKSALLHGKGAGCFHGAFMSIFRAKEPLFIFQLFQSGLFYREVRKNLGATINSINGSDLKKFTFEVPTDKGERDKIASVLSSADQEITALQQKLAALKQEKRALMQQLLTGKRRVKVEVAA